MISLFFYDSSAFLIVVLKYKTEIRNEVREYENITFGGFTYWKESIWI